MQVAKQEAAQVKMLEQLQQLDCEELSHKGRIFVLEPCKALFISIPKVACMSIMTFLKDTLTSEDEEHPQKLYATFPTVPKNKCLKMYPDYFRFCFVRNPWDRIVSLYSNKICLRHETENGIAQCLQQFPCFYHNMPFEEFVQCICNIPDTESNAHFMSQYAQLKDRKGNCIPNFIGKFENLHEDFRHVCSKIGLDGSTLVHENKSERKTYHSYYTEETRNLIGKRYMEDMHIFEYSF